jgi:hypothetical protein
MHMLNKRYGIKERWRMRYSTNTKVDITIKLLMIHLNMAGEGQMSGKNKVAA